jgi:hypothetical protein
MKEENMEKLRRISYMDRAWLSILLSLASLVFTLPVLFFLPWVWSPMMSGGTWPRDLLLRTGVYILFLVLNFTSVITAFHNRPNPTPWPGKIAMVMAVPVAVLVIPLALLMFVTFIQFNFIDGR